MTDTMRGRETRASRFATLVVLLSVGLAVVSPTVTHSAVPSAPATQWCSAMSTGKQVIDILGDSIMTGDAATQPAYQWHALLDQSFQSDGYGGSLWTGGSIDGSATADYVTGAKYSNHIEFTVNHPDLIVMDWGINDWSGYVPVATFTSQYQQIINRIRQLSPASTLLLVHNPWVYNSTLTATRGDQGQYLTAIKQLAQTNGTLFFGLEWFYSGDDRVGLYMPDLIHHNDRGQVVDYTAFRSYLLGLCGRG